MRTFDLDRTLSSTGSDVIILSLFDQDSSKGHCYLADETVILNDVTSTDTTTFFFSGPVKSSNPFAHWTAIGTMLTQLVLSKVMLLS